MEFWRKTTKVEKINFFKRIPLCIILICSIFTLLAVGIFTALMLFMFNVIPVNIFIGIMLGIAACMILFGISVVVEKFITCLKNCAYTSHRLYLIKKENSQPNLTPISDDDIRKFLQQMPHDNF